VKKHFIVLTLLIGFLGFANLVSAQFIILPNPLGNVNNFTTLFDNVAKYIFGLVGVLAVVMIIWAAILFLTSAGKEQQITAAKKALFYAVVGLAIALSGTGLIGLVKYIITGSYN